jgi:UDP-N-acetylmuramoyl-L-alanyl-D-glutamate--2,6-diaminopimelate ligase
MNLRNLIASIQPTWVGGSLNVEITSIHCDSREVQPGGLFIALPGQNTDGTKYAVDAVHNGAVAVIAQERLELPGEITMIEVSNARASMADVANEFYQRPGIHLKTIGVTGTNGKTTTTHLVKHVLDSALQLCGVVGTIHHAVGSEIIPADRTTPESLTLFKLLWQMRSAGCRCVAMEVSSHALVQDRVRGLEFDVAVFTNLTQDHLDFHHTMEEYYAAKSRLFDLLRGGKRPGVAVVNIDDRYGQQLVRALGHEVRCVTYGKSAAADFRASDIRMDVKGTTFQLNATGKSFLVRLPLIGQFNVANCLGALAAAHHCGVDLRTCVQAMANAPAVPGRLQVIPAMRNFRVFVDYAHTDDALVNVMRTLRELNPARLIVLFGCGGDRDRKKRSKMAAAVDQFADAAILTSDNPRFEDPKQIFEDTLAGFQRLQPEVIEDRKAAIEAAIQLADNRDIVLIAGKGHEDYQEIQGVRYPFDDVIVARRALEGRPAEHIERSRNFEREGGDW